MNVFCVLLCHCSTPYRRIDSLSMSVNKTFVQHSSIKVENWSKSIDKVKMVFHLNECTQNRKHTKLYCNNNKVAKLSFITLSNSKNLPFHSIIIKVFKSIPLLITLTHSNYQYLTLLFHSDYYSLLVNFLSIFTV